MTISLVQTASNIAGASTSVTVTLGSPTTPGNCLVACVAGGNGTSGGQVASITMGGSADNWAALKTAGDLAAGAEAVSIWADPNCAAGRTTVTITIAGVSVVLAQVFEFTGIVTSAVLDQFGTFDSAGASSAAFSVSTGGATVQASELAVGCVYGYNQTVTGPGSPWVNTSTLVSTTRTLQAGYQILSAAGTVTYAGSFGGSTFNGQVLVTLRGTAAPATAAANPAPPLIQPHPYALIRDEAQQRIDWAGAGVADLTVKFASTSGGVDTYNVTSPYNGTGNHPMRVLTPTVPNPGFAHGFLLMLPVEYDQQTGTYGDPIGIAQALGAHNGYNLTCVQPGYLALPTGSDGPWFADNPLNPGISQEKFTLLVTAWIRQHLAVTGLEQVYLTGFSRSGLGAQTLLFRNPYVFAAAASWDSPMGMTDYDGTDPVRGTTVGGNPADAYGTSANFTGHYQLSPGHLAAWQGTGQYGSGRIWIGLGPAFGNDVPWYDGQLTAAGIPHVFTFANTVEVHAWQPDWVAAGLQAIIPSQAPTTLPQQIARPLFTQLLQVAAWRTPVAAPPPPATAAAGAAAGAGTATAAGTVIATGSAAGAGAATAAGTIAAAGAAAGAGSVAATGGVIAPQAAAGSAAGAGAATAKTAIAATGSAAAAATTTAAGRSVPPFTVGFLTAATQRTGGPGG